MNKVTLLDREFHFGIGFLNELLNGLGVRLDELGQQDEVFLVPKMMYYSQRYAYNRQSKPIDFTLQDIFDLIDDNGGINGQFWTDFYTAFMDSMNKNVPADTSKKKAKAAK